MIVIIFPLLTLLLYSNMIIHRWFSSTFALDLSTAPIIEPLAISRKRSFIGANFGQYIF